jgi:tRNA (guanine37-N1)-methyltransferase
MRFDIISLFPETVAAYCAVSILGRAQQAGHISLHLHQLRDYAQGKYKKVDDQPFGGGTGMILKPEPVFAAHAAIPKYPNYQTVIFSPAGQTLNQKAIREKLIKPEQLIMICGRYEGFDQRITKLVDYNFCLGNYVLTGGEIGAMTLIDAVSRLIPGVLPKGSTVYNQDSFADLNCEELEAPQYTRPAEFQGLKVPDVLLSGNHQEIAAWRAKMRYKQTNGFQVGE